jgi:hypothetical protein
MSEIPEKESYGSLKFWNVVSALAGTSPENTSVNPATIVVNILNALRMIPPC